MGASQAVAPVQAIEWANNPQSIVDYIDGKLTGNMVVHTLMLLKLAYLKLTLVMQ